MIAWWIILRSCTTEYIDAHWGWHRISAAAHMLSLSCAFGVKSFLCCDQTLSETRCVMDALLTISKHTTFKHTHRDNTHTHSVDICAKNCCIDSTISTYTSLLWRRSYAQAYWILLLWCYCSLSIFPFLRRTCAGGWRCLSLAGDFSIASEFAPGPFLRIQETCHGKTGLGQKTIRSQGFWPWIPWL